MDDVPTVINERSQDESHLIGQLLNGTPVYWHLTSGDVILLDAEGEQTQQDITETNIDEYVLEREYTDPEGWKNLTPLGDFLRQVAPYKGVGGFDGKRLLSHRQSEAYAMRELLGLTRQRAAKMMGISKNTLDNHFGTAQGKIGQTLGIAGAVRDFRDADSASPVAEMLEHLRTEFSDGLDPEQDTTLEELAEEVRGD